MGSAFLIPSQVPYPTTGSPSRGPGRLSCAGLKLSKIVPQKPLFIFTLPFRVLRVQKYSFFHYWQHFFSFIFQKFVILLIHSEKNFNIERKSI
jgi:hypothetical protein